MRGLPIAARLRGMTWSRAMEKGRRESHRLRQRLHDRWFPSYASVPARVPELHRYFEPLPLEELRRDAARVAALAEHYLAHRFDLLGSGWVRVAYGARCAGVGGHRYGPGPRVEADGGGRWLTGLVNHANLHRSRSVWALVDPGYRPIDWQLDFKSGYRWSARDWWAGVPLGHLPGVDIKVPWELARMQHLVGLATAHALAVEGAPGFASAPTYAREFRNQVLDFVATNPPRFGVNWRLAMDVGIRAASWLAAYDLLRAHGAEFDPQWEAVFHASLLDHGRYIVEHLEWNPVVRGNHYLANVAGLLWIAAYLPATAEADGWLAFAARELLTETERQFTADGANFESSVPYHRLSAEMVVWSTALLADLPDHRRAALLDPPGRGWAGRRDLRPTPLPGPAAGTSWTVPESHLRRVAAMAEFTRSVVRPDGRVVQVGDNDSGRFLKLHPPFQRTTWTEARARLLNLADLAPDTTAGPEYWEEDHLDHRELLGWADALVAPDTAPAAGPPRAVSRVARGGLQQATTPLAPRDAGWEPCDAAPADPGAAEAGVAAHLDFVAATGGLRRGLARRAFADFGLYLFRGPALFLAVRCGRREQIVTHGHAHLDELSFELWIEGTPRVLDPGSYLYTALPAERNRYRAAEAHRVPSMLPPVELGDLSHNLFEVGGLRVARLLRFDDSGLVGELDAPGGVLRRRFVVEPDRVRVVDSFHPAGQSRAAAGRVRITSFEPRPDLPYSPGYGVQQRAPAATLDCPDP